MILGLHHAAMAVPQLDVAMDFYCGVLGFEVSMEAEVPSGFDQMSTALGTSDSGFKVRMIGKGGTRIELFEFNESVEDSGKKLANRIGITHIALACDDILKDFEHLSANGVTFNTQPFGEAPARFAYGRDPFGNIIELLECVDGED